MHIDTIHDQIDTFKDNLTPMRNVDGLLRNVDQYLGKIDAEKEWNDNPNEAYRMFLHTQSYSDFNKEDSLILLGRTGTGKTASFGIPVLHKVDVNSKKTQIIILSPTRCLIWLLLLLLTKY